MALLALAVVLPGCGGGDEPVEASATVDAGGGLLDGPDGSAVTVPAGALAAPTTLTIARDDTDALPLLAGWRALGSIYAFTPHGTAFDRPVQLTVPFDPANLPAGATPQLAIAELGGEWTVLSEVTAGAAALSAPSLDFSHGVVLTDGTGGPPRVTLSIAAPAGLPRYPAPGTLSVPLVDQPTTLTVRAAVRPGVVSLGTDWACQDTPTLKLQRSARPATPSAPFVWADVGTQSSTTTADFNVAVDAAANGWLYFRVVFDCTLKLPVGSSIDAELLPPWNFGYVWVRVDVPSTPPAAPAITTQPADATVFVGGSATFAVVATGNPAPTYQWRKNGVDIPGATQSSYTFTNAQSADNGSVFTVLVDNGVAPAATSNGATLTVTAPPTPSSGICTSSDPDGWCWVQPGPHSNQLSALAFDGTTVHAVGGRTSMRSGDGGTTWQTAFNAIDVYWYDLVSPASGVLLAAGFGGYLGFDGGIYRSTDGGQTWTRVLAQDVGAIAFKSATTGIAVGTGVWRTTDGGVNWSEVQAPGAMRFTRVVSPAPGVYLALEIDNSPSTIMRSVDGGLTWSTVASASGGDALVDVAFANGSLGVAVTGLGAVLRTTDSGASWSAPLAVAAFGGLQTVAFADANTVVAMGAGGQVYRSADAGLNWTPGEDLNFAGAEYLPRLKFRSANEGFVVGQYGQVWRTSDAGQNWSLVAGGSDLESFYSVKFRGGDGLAAGARGVWLTQDGGGSWTNVDGASSYDVALLDASVWVGVGFDVRRTTDGGQTWTEVHALASGSIVLAVDFVPSSGTATTGVAVGNSAGDGLMLRTTDAGLNWSPVVSIGTVPALYAVGFSPTTAGLGLAGGSQRALLRTTDGGATWAPVTLDALGANETIQSIRFTATDAMIAADRGLYRSTDGGLNWTHVYDSSGRGSMIDVTFLSATDAVAVGVSGTIVRSGDGGATWSVVDVPITVTLNGVASTGSSGEVVAVGDAGTILRNLQGGAP